MAAGTTTIRVDHEMAEQLRRFAAEDNTTAVETLRAMFRRERQRRMAIENAGRTLTPEDHAVIASSAATVRRAVGNDPRARR